MGGSLGKKIPLSRTAALLLAFVGQNAARRCDIAPPQLWRHWGCGRWDCGDLGGQLQGCQGTASGSECPAEHWSCGDGLRPSETFACIAGSWAEILPQCLGNLVEHTGNWAVSKQTVRLVLFSLNVSWVTNSTELPGMCSNETLEARSCTPMFSELLRANIWPLLLQPLQDALCRSGLPQAEGMPAVLAPGSCLGTLSEHGDRLRVAGASSGGASADGWLLLHVEALPALRVGAEGLQKDLAVLSSLMGTPLTGQQLWSATGPPGSAFLQSGFSKMRELPKAFGLASPSEEPPAWLPALTISVSQPYIINRGRVPVWDSPLQPKPLEDPYASLLLELQEAEVLVMAIASTVLGLLWLCCACCVAALFSLRGRTLQREDLRFVSIIGVVTDVVELTAGMAFFLLLQWLLADGVLEVLETGDWRRGEGPFLTLLLAYELLTVVPAMAMTLQLLCSVREQSLPKHCCSKGFAVRRRPWLVLYTVLLTAHSFAALGSLTLAVLQLLQDPLYGEIDTVAVSSCLQRQELAQCSEERQLPPFNLGVRQLCESDCQLQPMPAAHVAEQFGRSLCRIASVVAAWACLARGSQLCLVWQLVEAHVLDEKPFPGSQSGAGSPAWSPDAHGPATDTVLTPERFQAGVKAVERSSSRRSSKSSTASASKGLAGLPESLLADEAADPERRALAAALTALTEPQTDLKPKVAKAMPEDEKQQPSAAKTQVPATAPAEPAPKEAKDLLNFAQQIARQCSRDSIASKESAAAQEDEAPRAKERSQGTQGSLSTGARKRFVADW